MFFQSSRMQIHLFTTVFCTVFFCCVSQSWAFYNYRSDDLFFSVNGFGTTALTTTDSDEIGFIRHSIQTETAQKGRLLWETDSSLGLQFMGGNRKVQGVVQLLAKDSNRAKTTNYINYAYLDLKFGSNFSMRIGRIPYDIYIHGNMPSLDFAHPWLRTPTTLYNQIGSGYAEGASFTYDHYFQKYGELRAGIFTGGVDIGFYFDDELLEYEYQPFGGLFAFYSPVPEIQINAVYISPDRNEEVPLLGSLMNDWQQTPVTFASTARKAENLLHGEGSGYSDYFCLGFSWEPGSWRIVSEYDQLNLRRFGNAKIFSGYASMGYSFDVWTPYVLLGYTKIDKDTISLIPANINQLPSTIQDLVYVTQGYYDWFTMDQSNVSFGVRWDFCQSMALKFQWDHYWLKKDGTLFWTKFPDKEYDGNGVNVFAVALNFIF